METRLNILYLHINKLNISHRLPYRCEVKRAYLHSCLANEKMTTDPLQYHKLKSYLLALDAELLLSVSESLSSLQLLGAPGGLDLDVPDMSSVSDGPFLGEVVVTATGMLCKKGTFQVQSFPYIGVTMAPTAEMPTCMVHILRSKYVI